MTSYFLSYFDTFATLHAICDTCELCNGCPLRIVDIINDRCFLKTPPAEWTPADISKVSEAISKYIKRCTE